MRASKVCWKELNGEMSSLCARPIRKHDILGPFFRVLVIHHPVQTREVGWACRVALQQNTRYMRNETERLNPQNLSVVVISDTPCALAMMRCQAGWSVRLVVCTPMSHSEQREKCMYIVPLDIDWIPLQQPVCLGLPNLLGQYFILV